MPDRDRAGQCWGGQCRGRPVRAAGQLPHLCSQGGGEGLPKAEKANQTKTFGALQARFKDQLRFSTKPLNKTMLNAALAVGSALPAESRAQRVLRLLQLWPPLQGRDFDGELPAEQQGGDGDRGALCEIALTFSFGVVVCGPRDAI